MTNSNFTYETCAEIFELDSNTNYIINVAARGTIEDAPGEKANKNETTRKYARIAQPL